MDTYALLRGVTLQCHAPEQRDTAKDVLLFLDPHVERPLCPLILHFW